MLRKPGRVSPAFVLACLALFAALAGGVYAAAKIDGHSIRAKSLPGNRVVPGSLPGDRLRPGSIPANRLSGAITGRQIEARTLGEVPEAGHARAADSAREARTALRADDALNAQRINGRRADCDAAARYFAGACWDRAQTTTPLSAPAAAAACAERGGELPEALALAAFAGLDDVVLAEEGEWSNEIPVISGPNEYAVVTVTDAGVIDPVLSTATRAYRCVFPLVG
jgi:hypothetical protein